MKRNRCIALLWLALLYSNCGIANDSIARVGTGGLILLKSDDIRMVEETLTISTSKIRVHYRFRNESKQDIKTVVAFPMPEYGYDPGFSDRWANRARFSWGDFSIQADGKRISAYGSRAAVYKGKDITEALRKIGLSDRQIFETFGDCEANYEDTTISCSLPDEQKARIDKLIGRVSAEPQYWVAPWDIADSAYWEQTFPAGKEIEVTHEYKPLVGKNQSPDIGKDGCPDDGSERAVEKRIKATSKDRSLPFGSTDEVEYILGTGRNWKGPISKFRLLIEKKYPEEIVSLCFPGKGKKLSPTLIEFTQSNYTPQDRLIIYFVYVPD